MMSICCISNAQSVELHLSFSSLTFTDTDPLSRLDIPAQETPVAASVTYAGPGIVNIYMLAGGDLTGANNGRPIPASDIYWTGIGSGYEGGTLSKTSATAAATGNLAQGVGDGWRFYLKSGIYDSDTYSVSITVMATAE